MTKDSIFVLEEESNTSRSTGIILFLKKDIMNKFVMVENKENYPNTTISIIEGNDPKYWEEMKKDLWNDELKCFIFLLGFENNRNIMENVRNLENAWTFWPIGNNLKHFPHKRKIIDRIKNPIRNYMMGIQRFSEYD